MKHHGNVTKINGAEVEPVDIVSFGSPCQDLSVAGKRAGIQDGERSNLFFEAIRIIKEMREATNGEYPKYAVWENVPGAFSSNKGHDFHAVLEALCSVCDDTVSVPEPYDPKRTKLVWNKAGEIVGDNYSIAWRTLDAQYWGVPQRRKRIYLVADFGGQRAREILFKPDSLRGDMQTGDETWQGAAADAVGSVDGGVGVECLNPWDCQSKRIYNPDGIYCTLPAMDCGGANNQAVIFSAAGFCQGASPAAQTIGYQEEIAPTVKGAPSGTAQVPAVVVVQDGGETARTLAARYDSSPCADRGQNVVVIALQANGIDRADTAGCNGCGWRENESYTLNTVDRHAVCYDARGNGDGETSCTITRESICNKNQPIQRRYIIRRLLPVECARLQGFPDTWGHLAPYDPADAEFWEDVRKTHAEINGKKYKPTKNLKKWYEGLHTDSAEYKMWGNGIALPNAEFVLNGIAGQGAKTLGSLFDGSGGFPLAGVLNGIKPLWASEVEPYAIAVTKSRFREVHNGK